MTKMKPGDKVKLPAAMATLYEAVDQLRQQYDRPFTLDGHLIGSIGEVLAREAFGFELNPPSYKGHDGKCTIRGDVEIKTTAGESVAFRGDCNR